MAKVVPKRPTTLGSGELTKAENITLPSTTYKRHSGVSQRSDTSANGEDFFIPMALDPNPAPGPSPLTMKPNFEVPPEYVKSQLADANTNSRDYFNAKGSKPTVRKVSQDHPNTYISPPPDSPRDSRPSSGPSSPHIAYQEIGRDLSHDNTDHVRKRRDNSISGATVEAKTRGTHNETPSRLNGESRNGKFTLGEVPKNKKANHSAKSSKSETMSPVLDTSLGSSKSKSAPASANAHVKEQQMVSPPTGSPTSMRHDAELDGSSQTTQDSRSHDNASLDSSTSHSSPVTTQLRALPQRGDSLARSADARVSSKRDELGGRGKISTKLVHDDLLQGKPSSAPPTTTGEFASTTYPNVNGNRSTPKPKDSPSSASNTEIPYPPPRARDRVTQASISNNDAFSTPRAPPQAPSGYHKARNESISTIKSESPRNGEHPVSPKLPIRAGGCDFSIDDDMARILGNDAQQDHSSFLRRFSNSVRHARSYSDRGIRHSKEQKWPKSPLIGGPYTQEISSPTSSSPETRDELAWFRNELHRERQRTSEKEQKLQELEAALEAKTNIRQMNSELREKRSTMVVLDTQKEIVIRELEVLTEHIAAAKKSGEPLDVGKMTNVVVREFAESLQKLKDSFKPQIEDLTQKRNDLLDEVANLTQFQEKSFSEFEQLSLKNAQLAELNNQLVHQIQELYKANAGPALDVVRPPPNGLGIYTHHQKDQSSTSIDAQQQRPSIADSGVSGSTAVHEQDQGDATYLSAPQLVNIKRAQPKKFNWKRGGQNVAKGVTKGLKGAFKSDETKLRDGHFENGMPYGSIPPNQEFSLGSVPKSQILDPSRQGFGFFGTQKKPVPQQQWTNQQTNGSAPQSASGPPGKPDSTTPMPTTC